MEEEDLVKKLNIMNNPYYFHRVTYERLAKHNCLDHLTSLKCLNHLGPEKLSKLDKIGEISLICDTAFTDRDVELILKNNAPITAEAYSTFIYNSKDQSVLAMKFYFDLLP